MSGELASEGVQEIGVEVEFLLLDGLGRGLLRLPAPWEVVALEPGHDRISHQINRTSVPPSMQLGDGPHPGVQSVGRRIAAIRHPRAELILELGQHAHVVDFALLVKR